MLLHQILVPVLLLIAHCTSVPVEDGKCMIVKEEENATNPDTLYCENVNKQQVIEAIKEKQNENITQISIWFTNLKQLPLQEVLDTNLQDRLRYFAVINNTQPLTLDENSFKHFKKLEILLLENLEILLTERGALNPLRSLHRLESRHVRFKVLNEGDKLELLPLQILVVEKTPLKIFPADYLKNMPHLTYVTLQGNQIEKIQDGAFDNNKNIHTLNLNDNLLTTIPKNLFSNIHRLYLLDLSYNPMKECLPLDEMIVANDNLKNLYIHGWPCSTLTRCLTEWKKLHTIECDERDHLVQYHGSNCTRVIMKIQNKGREKIIRLTRNVQSFSELLGDTNVDDIACLSDKKLMINK